MNFIICTCHKIILRSAKTRKMIMDREHVGHVTYKN